MNGHEKTGVEIRARQRQARFRLSNMCSMSESQNLSEYFIETDASVLSIKEVSALLTISASIRRPSRSWAWGGRRGFPPIGGLPMAHPGQGSPLLKIRPNNELPGSRRQQKMRRAKPPWAHGPPTRDARVGSPPVAVVLYVRGGPAHHGLSPSCRIAGGRAESSS
jgi:hypothetical protein